MSPVTGWKTRFKEATSPLTSSIHLPGHSPRASQHASKPSQHSSRQSATIERPAAENGIYTQSPTNPRREFSRKASKRAGTDLRPGQLQRMPSVQTHYMDMLLSQDTIPRWHNISASFFQWVLLAGFLVLPATFNSISESDRVQTSSEAGNLAAKAALAAVKNVPLLYVGAFCAGVGLLGKVWLWIAHFRNYVWLVNKIFMYVPHFERSKQGRVAADIQQARLHEFVGRIDLNGGERLFGAGW